jgi:hypothetical protein
MSLFRPSTDLPWTDAEINKRVRKAVHHHWTYRERQAAEQRVRGVRDAGSRGDVTGGQHLHGFRDLLNDIATVAGCDEAEYRRRSGSVLPGWYRATKSWDWVLSRDDQLLAAVEFKSMVGSVGNNLNNRAEEVLGLARDFWEAHDRGLFDGSPSRRSAKRKRPFLGYVYLLGTHDDLDRSVQAVRTRYSIDPVFEDVTYYDRFGALCKRLVENGEYTAVSFLKARNTGTGEFEEPFPEVCFSIFARTLYTHIRVKG